MGYILGISAYYHDSAACLLKDAEIIAAAQEERFSRIKNDESFPTEAIKFCLKFANISLAEVDHVVFYEKPFLKFERLLETYVHFAPRGLKSFLKAMPIWLKDKLFIKKKIARALNSIDPKCEKSHTILFTDHHHAHAASAFYPSPFEKAVVLTVDGVGEWATTTVSIGNSAQLTLKKEINFPNSIGLLYSAFTYYLGFKVNSDEYKVMGLASYGQPVYKQLIYDHLIDVKADGSFLLNMNYFNYCTGLKMTNKKFDKLFGHPVRGNDEEILAFHKDLASSIQRVTEEIMIKLTQSLYREFAIENLCLAGGVALNCIINSSIRKHSGFKNIWVQPAAGDAGGALGAAYSVYNTHLSGIRNSESQTDGMKQSLLGPSYTQNEVITALRVYGLNYEKVEGEFYHREIAAYLAEGKIIAYFKGRTEFGPRALGCRSILADPRKSEMKAILNAKIKFRESFRPFAPAILEEFASLYFGEGPKNRYMLFTENYLGDQTGRQALDAVLIPGAVHVDGTARVQAVSKVHHPDFHQLITAFYNLTECPAVINTSLNVMNEPMASSPEDAICCFLNTEIDILAIEGLLVNKKKIGL
ncbi:carbamoyltransferase family protein [Pedobacter terrae]|uniref:carbamoyltransferase family protein n=1 Tax=Pedobacter terrae TaxID=405671 RepID=UPI002FF9FDC0